MKQKIVPNNNPNLYYAQGVFDATSVVDILYIPIVAWRVFSNKTLDGKSEYTFVVPVAPDISMHVDDEGDHRAFIIYDKSTGRWFLPDVMSGDGEESCKDALYEIHREAA